MEKFLNNDAGFVKWLQDNPQGYVVNDRGSDGLMMYRATCDHFQPHDEWAKTTNLKACSLEKRELEIWAGERNESLLNCDSCM